MLSAFILATLATSRLIATDPPPRPKLLIVLADTLSPDKDSADLTAFLAQKRERYDTELVRLSTAIAPTPSTTSADDAERLKRFLFTRWKSGTSSVLLIGDADIMPVRYMCLDRVTAPAFDYAFYPCDLYYADVAKADASFDDWNGATSDFHAAYFGEVRGEKNKSDPMNYDQISYIPELALGRWPVSTPAQLKTVIDKTITYEKAVLAEKDTPKAAVAMVAGWIDARPQLDAFAKLLEAPTSSKPFTTARFFYKDADTRWSAANPPIEPPTEKTLLDQLNSGARLILHAGHGNDNVWEHCLSTNSIAKMTNAACPAVMMSAGCSTARFATLPPYEAYTDIHGHEHKGTDAGEVFTAPPPPPAIYAKGPHNRSGLGESLLRDGPNGAVVYIGCNTGSQPAALTLMAGFVDGLSTKNSSATVPATAGDCWKHAIAYYYQHEHLATLKPSPDWYPASIYFQGMKFMFFGDPTVPMAPTAAAK